MNEAHSGRPPSRASRPKLVGGVRALMPLVALALALAAKPAQAKEVRVTNTWNLAASPDAVLDAMLDYPKMCKKGCPRYIPHLVKTIVLSYERHPDDFYIWMFIEDIQNAEWFSHVTVQRSDKRMRVTVQMVDPALGDSLHKLTKGANDPAFDICKTVYDIDTVEGPGGARSTRMTFTSQIQLSGLAAFFGSGIARGRLEEAADAVHRFLSVLPKVPPPAPLKAQ
jgi:hypothetical protein